MFGYCCWIVGVGLLLVLDNSCWVIVVMFDYRCLFFIGDILVLGYCCSCITLVTFLFETMLMSIVLKFLLISVIRYSLY